MIDLLNDTQLAYLAGLIDGEGSLECQKQMQKNGKTPRYILRLSFGMATQEPLITIAMWLNLKTKTYKPRVREKDSRFANYTFQKIWLLHY